ncbi:TPA: hypothetical protein HA295_02970 [Candidatus Woesearchaeota archaeon]|nr:hypothetical protein [Candidatus Woesearchaeota archaeon]
MKKAIILTVVIFGLAVVLSSCATDAAFSASQTSGDSPLEVTFAARGGFSMATVDFGDRSETQAIEIPDGNCLASTCQVTHRYASPGTYTARLYGPMRDSCDASGLCTMGQPILGTVKIEVTSGQKAGNTGSLPDSSSENKTLIHTRAGDLTLSYAGGNATLAGTLGRSTPCVDWQITAQVMESYPEQVIFDVHDASTAQVCIQMLGEPQQVSAAVQVSEKAVFTVLFEEEEVFRGTLSS